MKKAISILLCLLTVLGLTACGADESASPSSSINTMETSSDISSENSSVEETSKENKSSSKKATTSVNKGNSTNNGSLLANTSSGKKYPIKEKIINIRKSYKKYFKCLGRGNTDSISMGIDLNWSCASVEFDVDCTGELKVNLQKSAGESPIFIEIYVDGKLLESRTKIVDSCDITIAKNLTPGVHRVKIVRQTDCESPNLKLSKIYLYGTLVPKAPENSPLYIEAIGDSSLIGWGVRLPDKLFENFYTGTDEEKKAKLKAARDDENQDGTLAYPYVAAEKLNADSYIFAKQGVGIAATYHRSGGKAIPRAGLLPTMYDFCFASGDLEYTPDRQPDVIVLDAGSTDLSNDLLKSAIDGDKVGIDVTRANEIATEFLKNLKSKNPKAKIIWRYGLTSNNAKLKDHVLNAVKKAGGNAKGIYSLELPFSARSGYPSEKEYAAAADILVNKIKQITK